MNSNPDRPDLPQNDADAKPSDPKPMAEAGSKLKEAQAKLMEAEAKLMAPNAAGARPTAQQPAPQPAVPPKPVVVERKEPEPEHHGPSVPVTEQLSENVSAMLCYLFGWVSGLVFLLVDRRPYVRFHAAQSVAVFATLSILLLVFGGFFLGAIFPGAAGAFLFIRHLLVLVWIIAAVVLMLKAAGGERFRVRYASQYADRAAHGAR